MFPIQSAGVPVRMLSRLGYNHSSTHPATYSHQYRPGLKSPGSFRLYSPPEMQVSETCRQFRLPTSLLRISHRKLLNFQLRMFGTSVALSLLGTDKGIMLKISMVEGASQRRLVLEGKLIAPWAAELKAEYIKARQERDPRELVVDVRHLSTISQEGENVLLELMNAGVKFRCCGVFTRHVLKQLARQAHRQFQEATR
jgi:hypothetical protein